MDSSLFFSFPNGGGKPPFKTLFLPYGAKKVNMALEIDFEKLETSSKISSPPANYPWKQIYIPFPDSLEDTVMIKKVLILGGLALLVGFLFFGKSLVSYWHTARAQIHNTVQDNVPLEFQIERARGMVKDLVPEVRKNMLVIAKEEVEVKQLDEQIAQTESRLAKEKEQLLKLKNDLAGGKTTFTYAGRTYTTDQVKADMANRFDRYKTSEATLASLQQMKTARQHSLEAAQQKLEGMLAAKRQLAVEVENLEARLHIVSAAQTTSNYQFDDSQLGQAKELVSDLRTRLEVAERMVNAEKQFQGEIQLEAITPENIVDEVAEYFAEKTPEAAKVANN
jgi:hypothetical protein